MSSINEASSVPSESPTLQNRAPSVDSNGLAAISRLAEQRIAVPTHPDFASELRNRLASRMVEQSPAVESPATVEKVSAVAQPTVVAPKTQSPRLHPAEALRLVFEPYNHAVAEAGAALRASQNRR